MWVSSKPKSSADYFWSSDRQTKSLHSQKEGDERKKAREEEEPQSVKLNLITPICHGYIWTHTAADLLVQMMQKQSKGEIFLTGFAILFKQQAGKRHLPWIYVASVGLHEEIDSHLTRCMHKRTHANQKCLMILALQYKNKNTPLDFIY